VVKAIPEPESAEMTKCKKAPGRRKNGSKYPWRHQAGYGGIRFLGLRTPCTGKNLG